MKRLFILLILGIASTATAQVLNDAGTLGRGQFSLGVSPVLYSAGSTFRLFVDAGIGISSGLDLAVKAGLGNDPTYVGADLEFALLRSRSDISVTLGVHKFADVGLDGTFNLSFALTSQVRLYLGVDADVEFGRNDTRAPAWFFFGPTVRVGHFLELLFEMNAGLTNDATNIFAAGVKIYLN